MLTMTELDRINIDCAETMLKRALTGRARPRNSHSTLMRRFTPPYAGFALDVALFVAWLSEAEQFVSFMLGLGKPSYVFRDKNALSQHQNARARGM